MDAFETIVAKLLEAEGYWVRTSVKVNLTKAEKVKIGKPTSPRWELDVLAYQPKKNQVLVVECKSYLNSTGVMFRNGTFDPPGRYKLFTQDQTRKTVLDRLRRQMIETGLCQNSPTVTLCLAVGHMANMTDTAGLNEHFIQQGWRLFDTQWIDDRLKRLADSDYENDVIHVAAKIRKLATSVRTKSTEN